MSTFDTYFDTTFFTYQLNIGISFAKNLQSNYRIIGYQMMHEFQVYFLAHMFGIRVCQLAQNKPSILMSNLKNQPCILTMDIKLNDLNDRFLDS